MYYNLGSGPGLQPPHFRPTCWLQPQKLISHRHCFLLQAPADTPHTWDHVVQGNGIDAGMVFSYFWHAPGPEFTLPLDQGHFLYSHHIPELYDQV